MSPVTDKENNKDKDNNELLNFTTDMKRLGIMADIQTTLIE